MYLTAMKEKGLLLLKGEEMFQEEEKNLGNRRVQEEQGRDL